MLYRLLSLYHKTHPCQSKRAANTHKRQLTGDMFVHIHSLSCIYLFFGLPAPSFWLSVLCFFLFFHLLELLWYSLNLQAPLWSAPVHSLRGDPAHSVLADRSGAVRSPWSKWRRCPFSLGCASSNTSGSLTCFLSERRHRCERWDHEVTNPCSGIRFMACASVHTTLSVFSRKGESAAFSIPSLQRCLQWSELMSLPWGVTQ